MSQSFPNAGNAIIVLALRDVIVEHKASLSEVDGAIGDGDHGINMAKGFSMAADSLDPTASLSEGLKHLGNTLLEDIGGSMGPLYGNFFRKMARASRKEARITATVFETMLSDAITSLVDLGGAKVGDKTLLDVLDPAITAYREALATGESFDSALGILGASAEAAKEGTKDMVAKLGRAARLGERSRGVIDAGAASCSLILNTLSAEFTKRLG